MGPFNTRDEMQTANERAGDDFFSLAWGAWHTIFLPEIYGGRYIIAYTRKPLEDGKIDEHYRLYRANNRGLIYLVSDGDLAALIGHKNYFHSENPARAAAQTLANLEESGADIPMLRD